MVDSSAWHPLWNISDVLSAVPGYTKGKQGEQHDKDDIEEEDEEEEVDADNGDADNGNADDITVLPLVTATVTPPQLVDFDDDVDDEAPRPKAPPPPPQVQRGRRARREGSSAVRRCNLISA